MAISGKTRFWCACERGVNLEFVPWCHEFLNDPLDKVRDFLVAIVSPLVSLMEKQFCNLLQCLPLSATTHGKDRIYPMKADPDTVGRSDCRVAVASAPAHRCCFQSCCHVVCILLHTFHFAISERCELIAMYARPSLPSPSRTRRLSQSRDGLAI